MKHKRYPAEQIVNKLRQAEVMLSQGQMIAQASKALGITEQTYYRWRKEYGGLKTDHDLSPQKQSRLGTIFWPGWRRNRS